LAQKKSDRAIEEDIEDLDDEDLDEDDEALPEDVEEFVICTLDPTKVASTLAYLDAVTNRT